MSHEEMVKAFSYKFVPDKLFLAKMKKDFGYEENYVEKQLLENVKNYCTTTYYLISKDQRKIS